jgi:hypothetical protein
MRRMNYITMSAQEMPFGDENLLADSKDFRECARIVYQPSQK